MFDALRYLKDNRIQYALEGKDISPGWAGVSCPFCRDPLMHGGFNLAEGYYSCWRCGGHDVVDVVAALEKMPIHKAVLKVQDYSLLAPPQAKRRSRARRAGSLAMPAGTGPLGAIHKAYLRKRGFDPDELEAKYGLLGTGPVGPYRLRIIAPVLLDGELISYQGRDVTGKAEISYKACKKENEIIEHKDSLYNVDNARGEAIVVEGIFDVWRMGDGAVATFGVGFRWSQVQMLAERFQRVHLLYDGEPKAQDQARKIVRALGNLGVKAENVLLGKGDPAELTPEEAARLKEDLLK